MKKIVSKILIAFLTFTLAFSMTGLAYGATSSATKINTLLPSDKWFSESKAGTSVDNITLIEIQKEKYSGEYKKSWNIDKDKKGKIKCYSVPLDNGKYKLVISGKGKTIYLNKNSSGFFNGFHNVTRISGLDYINTKNATDMSSFFRDCNSLISLDIDSFKTSKVTKMNSMFYRCKKLCELDLSSFDTSNVTRMQFMFYGCSSIKKLNLNNFNTAKVEDMSAMFRNCKNLEELYINNFSTKKVKYFSSMFSNCKKIKSIDVSNFNTSRAENLCNMFSGCEMIDNLNVSNFDTSKVTDMSEMFMGCKNLTSLDLSNFKYKKGVNKEKLTYDCFNKQVSDNNSSDINSTEYKMEKVLNLVVENGKELEAVAQIANNIDVEKGMNKLYSDINIAISHTYREKELLAMAIEECGDDANLTKVKSELQKALAEFDVLPNSLPINLDSLSLVLEVSYVSSIYAKNALTEMQNYLLSK